VKPRLLIITAILLAGIGAVMGTLGLSPPFARPDRAPIPTPTFGHGKLEVVVHPPLVLGAIDSGLVTAALNSRLDEVRRCFEPSVPPLEPYHASITLRLELSTGGRVMAVHVLGSSEDPGIDACMGSTASRWVFPPPNTLGASIGATFDVTNRRGLELGVLGAGDGNERGTDAQRHGFLR